MIFEFPQLFSIICGEEKEKETSRTSCWMMNETWKNTCKKEKVEKWKSLPVGRCWRWGQATEYRELNEKYATKSGNKCGTFLYRSYNAFLTRIEFIFLIWLKGTNDKGM